MTGRVLLRGPDDAIRLYFRLAERERTAGGLDPFLMKGYVAARRCSVCEHNRYVETPRGKGGQGWVTRCARCGAVWPLRVECVLRGTIRTSRSPHSLEGRLVRLSDLEHAVNQIPESDRLVYALYIATDRSYAYVAELATTYALEDRLGCLAPADGYTEKRVRGIVKRGRRILTEALVARGLMPRRLSVRMRDGTLEAVDALEPLPRSVVVPESASAWDGLLQDIERSLDDCGGGFGLTRLELTSEHGFGLMYRQVPLRENGGREEWRRSNR